MKKNILIGTIQEDNKNYQATIQIELKQKEKGLCLSICGDISRNSKDWLTSGQCIDTILSYFPKDEKMIKIHDIWQKYHLNDMHADCEHQRKNVEFQKAKKEKIIVYKWLHLKDELREEKKQVDKYIKDCLKNDGKCTLNTRQQFLYNLDDCKYNHIGEYNQDLYTHKEKDIEYKVLSHIKQDEHEKGLLLKECSECGYKYGSSWLYEEIPSETIEYLKSL